jgi:N-acetyl-anhydromuramyl-L-alanine amidase AmpD
MRYGALFLVCLSASAMGADTRVGERVDRRGDEIMICGQLFHTTTKVVLWTDPGGYDAYRVEKRFTPEAENRRPVAANANASERGEARYNLRRQGLTAEQIERVRGGGWDLPLLQQVVDQFVIHYDARGTSRRCFEVLQDKRGLSVHFMLDLDGTIYQTLDLKERAWHATVANSRSVGIEIANIGAWPVGKSNPLGDWYHAGADGRVTIVDPEAGKIVDPLDFSRGLHPARNEKIDGTIQGQELEQYDLTPQQYEALVKLTATLCTVFPMIRCDYPRDEKGRVIPHKLPNDQLANYHGILGHYHVQTDKTDPGPAFQWDHVIDEARRLQGR